MLKYILVFLSIFFVSCAFNKKMESKVSENTGNEISRRTASYAYCDIKTFEFINPAINPAGGVKEITDLVGCFKNGFLSGVYMSYIQCENACK